MSIEAPKEYIWYCPRPTCNAIVMKTRTAFVPEGKFSCKRCTVIVTGEEIMVRNAKNVARYLQYLNGVATRWTADLTRV